MHDPRRRGFDHATAEKIGLNFKLRHYRLSTSNTRLCTAFRTGTYRVDSRVCRPVSTAMRDICAARRLHPRAVSSPAKRTVFSMRNGLYSLHMHMLDGVKGRDSGVIVLRDGSLIGGGP